MGNSQSKIELYAAIRRDHRMGMSLRGLQRTHNVTWRTVRRALDGQWSEPRKKQRRKESRLDPYKPLIDGMLLADLDAPPKQRHTAQRIYDCLVEGQALSCMADFSQASSQAFLGRRPLVGEDREVHRVPPGTVRASAVASEYAFAARPNTCDRSL